MRAWTNAKADRDLTTSMPNGRNCCLRLAHRTKLEPSANRIRRRSPQRRRLPRRRQRGLPRERLEMSIPELCRSVLRRPTFRSTLPRAAARLVLPVLYLTLE